MKKKVETQTAVEDGQSLERQDSNDGPVELVEALKNIAAQDKQKEDDTVELPYGGVMGYTMGKLYEDPVDLRDPILNPLMVSLDSLPGTEGSEERNQAIQNLIEERLQAALALEKAENFSNLVRPLDPVPSLLQQVLQDFTLQGRTSPSLQEAISDAGFNVMLLFIFALFNFVVSAGLHSFLDWWIALDFVAPAWLKP